MKPFIRIAPNVEYSTDFEFFRERQIAVTSSQDGTTINSCLEHRVFMRTGVRNISDNMILLMCREIHRDICNLRYGGELTD